jgi:hypothetical protein
MRFEFVGTDADGVVTESASAKDSGSVKSVHQSLGGPIFDSNVIDLVVASLPLERGFSAELPFFIYERGGRVPMTVAVRDRSTFDSPTLGKRDAWVVTVGVPGAPATVWVDSKTHAVLRVRYDIAARGCQLHRRPVTPLRIAEGESAEAATGELTACPRCLPRLPAPLPVPLPAKYAAQTPSAESVNRRV